MPGRGSWPQEGICPSPTNSARMVQGESSHHGNSQPRYRRTTVRSKAESSWLPIRELGHTGGLPCQPRSFLPLAV